MASSHSREIKDEIIHQKQEINNLLERIFGQIHYINEIRRAHGLEAFPIVVTNGTKEDSEHPYSLSSVLELERVEAKYKDLQEQFDACNAILQRMGAFPVAHRNNKRYRATNSNSSSIVMPFVAPTSPSKRSRTGPSSSAPLQPESKNELISPLSEPTPSPLTTTTTTAGNSFFSSRASTSTSSSSLSSLFPPRGGPIPDYQDFLPEFQLLVDQNPDTPDAMRIFGFIQKKSIEYQRTKAAQALEETTRLSSSLSPAG